MREKKRYSKSVERNIKLKQIQEAIEKAKESKKTALKVETDSQLCEDCR